MAFLLNVNSSLRGCEAHSRGNPAFKINLIDLLQDFILKQGLEKIYYIGYSGGLDSSVLLHSCANIREKYSSFEFRAVHVHHGLSPLADAWAVHCEETCAHLRVEFILKKIVISAQKGESLEAVAREKRYAIFTELLEDKNILLTAHHQDDQAETLLLQLFRGAGMKGLSAMPILKPFGRGQQGRPFLSISRAMLNAYATENALQWIDDESNQNKNFTRNFIRHDILPLLEKRWSNIAATLSRTAQHCAETQALIESLIAPAFAACYDANYQILSIKKLLQFDAVQQRAILRAWFTHLNFSLPSANQLHQIQQDFLYAKEDRFPMMQLNNLELHRYRDALYAIDKLKPHDKTQVIVWDTREPLVLPNIGCLRAEEIGLSPDLLFVTVRFREGGERLLMPNGRHCTLKNFFQKHAVPPWLRDRVPLIYNNNHELVAVFLLKANS